MIGKASLHVLILIGPLMLVQEAQVVHEFVKDVTDFLRRYGGGLLARTHHPTTCVAVDGIHRTTADRSKTTASCANESVFESARLFFAFAKQSTFCF